MDLNYQNNIKKWLEISYSTQKHNQFHDLHIDEIDSEIPISTNLIVDFSLECFFEAEQLRKTLNIPMSIALAIPLQSKRTYQGVNFHSKKDIINLIDVTPPSLYLIDINDKNWKETPRLHINHKIDFLDKNVMCYYSEYKEMHEVEYRRVLWLLINPQGIHM